MLLIDAEKLLENTGVVLNWGDNQGQYQEAIDAVNEAGGVLGRQIDPVFVFVDPLSQTGYEEACVQLTQDEQVFAVIGFTRPADAALCYADTGDTPFVGYLSDITGDVFARAELPMITSNALPERTRPRARRRRRRRAERSTARRSPSSATPTTATPTDRRRR